MLPQQHTVPLRFIITEHASLNMSEQLYIMLAQLSGSYYCACQYLGKNELVWCSKNMDKDQDVGVITDLAIWISNQYECQKCIHKLQGVITVLLASPN